MKRQASQENEAYDPSSQPNKRQRNDEYGSVNQNNVQANMPHAHASIRPPPPLPRLDYTTFLCYQVVIQTGQTTYAFPGGWTLSCMNQNNMPPARGSFPSALPLPQLDYTTLLSSHTVVETGHTMFHFPAGWTLLSPLPRSWYDQPNEWQGHAHSAQLQQEIFCQLQCMYQYYGYRSSFAQGSYGYHIGSQPQQPTFENPVENRSRHDTRPVPSTASNNRWTPDFSMFVSPPSHPRSSQQGAGNIGLALDLMDDTGADEFDLDAVEFEDC